jgi:serine phosphatase RsbU (regulator of sigma subunit)
MNENTSIFTRYIGKECINPANYVTAFLIGAAINIAQGNAIFFSTVPYIIPLFVQALSKASVRFKNKDLDILTLLPGERRDPTFVADLRGKIIASKGNTKKFFKKNRIENIHQLFDETDARMIMEFAKERKKGPTAESFELYSELTRKWYQVQIKLAGDSNHMLIWLNDISSRKTLDSSLLTIRKFSGEMISSINELIKTDGVYDRVSSLIITEGYYGVFITRKDKGGDLFGYVFKKDQDILVRSELIKIAKDSEAPVFDSRKKKRIVAVIKSATETQKDFEDKHQFDKRVKEFLAVPVTNFINFHEGGLSIIAFNKKYGINRNDFFVMETVVNTARSIAYLIELAIGNNRFLSALEVAEEVQQNLLPQKSPLIEGFDVAGKSIYSNKTGGDYYDFLYDPEKPDGPLSIVVGDVAGHGIAAALLMATARALIRSESLHGESISQVLNEVNRHLTFDIHETGRFMTLFYLTIDPFSRRIRWVRAGHDPAILYDPVSDDFKELKGKGLALGVDEHWLYEENEVIDLSKGQIIFIGTDGIWEACNSEGTQFGKEPIYDIIRQNAALGSSEILEMIINTLNRFKAGLEVEDDITMVVVKIEED